MTGDDRPDQGGNGDGRVRTSPGATETGSESGSATDDAAGAAAPAGRLSRRQRRKLRRWARPAHAAAPALATGSGGSVKVLSPTGAGPTAADRTPAPAPGPGPDPAPGVVVDPRMRSRRIAVRRDAGRRRLRLVTLVLALAAAAVGALVLTQSPVLDIDRVRVSGTGHTAPDEVIRASGVRTGEPMVGVDPGDVRRRVGELPWVDEVTVRRVWPSTVELEVTERSVAAMVQVTDDRAAFVDTGGRVLSIEPRAGDATADPAGPLVLTGVSGRLEEGELLPADARDALTVAERVAERMPGVVASVSVDLDAALVEGGAIRFGSTEQLDDKVTAAKTVLDAVDTACLETLDIRVPGSPALTRNQRCS
jgi:cell division protein FtsQ